MADKDDVDLTPSGGAPADPPSTGETPPSSPQAGGSHAFVPGGGAEPDGIIPDPDLSDVGQDDIDIVGRDGRDARDPDGHLNDSDDVNAAPAHHDAEDEAAAEPSDGTEKELVAVGAGAGQLKAAGAEESTTVARTRQKKAKATPRQKQVEEKERRTGPVTFLRESVSELQKVVYPTGQQLINYFVVVLIFVLFIIAIVSVLDFAFGKAIIAVFS